MPDHRRPKLSNLGNTQPVAKCSDYEAALMREYERQMKECTFKPQVNNYVPATAKVSSGVTNKSSANTRASTLPYSNSGVSTTSNMQNRGSIKSKKSDNVKSTSAGAGGM